MSDVVLDCSAVLCWCFEDEATNASDRLLAQVERHGAVVPAHWRVEVANVLLRAERRRRITRPAFDGHLSRLARLPIRIDSGDEGSTWGSVVDLARQERLTVYDAAYLELAARFGIGLATKDRELVAAARRRGVDLFLLLDA